MSGTLKRVEEKLDALLAHLGAIHGMVESKTVDDSPLEVVSTAIPAWAVRQIEAVAKKEDRKFSFVLRRMILSELNPQA